jgi:dTDP-L-rhamnose 4-epimerase
VFEFARMMVEASGQDVEPLVPGEFRVGDTRHTVSDISRIRELGWEPTIPVETNVREYLEWIERQAPSHDHLLTAERVMAQTGVVRRVD